MKNLMIPLICALIIVLVFGVYRYIFYGSVFRACNYTEKTLEVPSELKEGSLALTQTTDTITNSGEYGCLKSFNVRGTQLVEKMASDNWFAGTEKSTLNPPLLFKVQSIHEITKHGISTIDSGPGPLHYLVVQDENGKEYILPTMALGINDEDRFLEFIDASGRYSIGPENFIDYSGVPRFRFDKKFSY